MPFGSEWVRDLDVLLHVHDEIVVSPMPFGSEWVRDRSGRSPRRWPLTSVSNAFRQ